MTPQHGYAQAGGGAAGRGIVLVIVAIALGAFLLARGFDGSDDGGGSADAASTDTGSDSESSDGDGDSEGGEDDETDPASTTSSTTTTTSTAPPPVTHPRGDVKVVAINGKGAPGLAGAATEKLNGLGFTTMAKNAVNFGMTDSVIYYQDGYGEDAKSIADELNAPADILRRAPANILDLVRDSADVSDFNIFILLAEDDLIPIPV